jgi:carbon-monoxide dehydrogenase medium subunit
MAEALQLLARPNAVPLAGGTQLLAAGTTSEVVDLQALALNQIEWQASRLHIGATARLTDLAEVLAGHEEGGAPAGLLRRAIRKAGPNTYRNAATAGGVVASRLPDSELLAALLVLDAEILLLSPGESSISLAAYLGADEAPSGLITEILLPWVPGAAGSERVARTPSDYPIVSITAWLPGSGLPRVAATGISPRPLRLVNVEARLEQGLTAVAIEAAATAARVAATHPGDFRGDASYRAEMAAVLTRRVCRALAAGG